MSKEKRIIKIAKMHEAYKEITEGLSILKELYNDNNDVRYYVWKLEKIHGQLQNKLLRLLKKEQLDEDWERLVLQLKGE